MNATANHLTRQPSPHVDHADSDDASFDALAPRHPHTLVGLSPFPTEWVWPDHIPLGRLTLLDGDPGCGKSLLALTIAAAVSSGHSSLPGADTLPVGSVLLVSPFDHLQDTILPRLLAAGADPARVFCLQSLPTLDPHTGIDYDRPLCLPQDLSYLVEQIGHLQPRLVILDALTDLLLPSACALVLAELHSVADTFNCAILLLRSVRTQPADLVRPRLTGPAAFKLAPAALLCVPHPQHPDHSILLPSRCTLGPRPAILAYHITPTDQHIPTIHWIAAPPAELLPLLAGVGPRYCAQHYAILQCLHQSHTSLNAKEVAAAIGFDDEPVRKMLQRMLLVGDLISPDRGQYTTPGHPCLTASPPSMQRSTAAPAPVAAAPLATAERSTPHTPAAPLPDALSEPAHSDVAPPPSPVESAAPRADITNAPVPNVPSKNRQHAPTLAMLTGDSTPAPASNRSPQTARDLVAP